MPIYTYRCENCGVQFERHQKFSEQPLSWCPECSKKTLRKIYQPVGIVFKGSGFYATDHRSPSGNGRSQSNQKSDESGEKKKSDPTEKNDTTASAKSDED